MKISVAGNVTPDFKEKLLAALRRENALRDAAAKTEAEEMRAECLALGRDIADIVVRDDRDGFNHAPASHRFQATWGESDLDCLHGDGPTPQAAMWDLIDATDVKS